MDPISAAGIGLSVTSLALQIFAGCIKGYQMFLDIKDMPENYQHLRTRLQIEQTRCLLWGEKVGIMEEYLERPSRALQLNHNLILDILMQIQQSFRSCMKVTSKFDPVVETFLQRAVQPSKLPTKATFLERTLAFWTKSGRASARVEWMMVKKDKFESLIQSLIHFNARVESFLDRDSLEEVRKSQAQSNMIQLQLAEGIAQLKDFVQALQVERRMNVEPDLSLSRSPTLPGDANDDNATNMASLASLAGFKAQFLGLEKGTVEISPHLLRRTEEIVFPSSKLSSSELATMNGASVWVEWRETSSDLHKMPVYKASMEDRVKKLAMLLSAPDKPKSFRAPDCVGYFLDESRRPSKYALVYAWPLPKTPAGARLATLREAYQSRSRVPLATRISLACQLAESLTHLHAVNWLHKGIRSDTILFTAVRGQDIILSNMIVSGFELSRPAQPDEMTLTHVFPEHHDLYRHPNLLKPDPDRSRKSYDIYSVGLILAEIALWKPIEQITDIEVRRLLLPEVRSRMLDNRRGILDTIAERAGETYANIVYQCIIGGKTIGVPEGADEEDPRTGMLLQSFLQTEVVAKLRSLKV